MDSDCAGQFLIDPSRTIIKPDGEKFTIQGERAIACGALGGFSGFLNKEFRVHDYFLGRHNCKIFLKEYFTIPDDAKNANPIFSAGYEGITSDKYRAKDGSWQIIPIVDDDVDYNFPVLNFTNSKSWPKQHWEVINKYNDPLKKRCAAIIMNLVKYKPLVRVFLWIGTRILLRGMIAKAAMKTVKEELTAWDLLI
jgi:hypothetical protein